MPPRPLSLPCRVSISPVPRAAACSYLASSRAPVLNCNTPAAPTCIVTISVLSQMEQLPRDSHLPPLPQPFLALYGSGEAPTYRGMHAGDLFLSLLFSLSLSPLSPLLSILPPFSFSFSLPLSSSLSPFLSLSLSLFSLSHVYHALLAPSHLSGDNMGRTPLHPPKNSTPNLLAYRAAPASPICVLSQGQLT